MATMTNDNLCHDEWWFVQFLKLTTLRKLLGFVQIFLLYCIPWPLYNNSSRYWPLFFTGVWISLFELSHCLKCLRWNGCYWTFGLVWVFVERCLNIWKKYFLKTCWHECSNAKINQGCCDFESIKIIVMPFLLKLTQMFFQIWFIEM